MNGTSAVSRQRVASEKINKQEKSEGENEEARGKKREREEKREKEKEFPIRDSNPGRVGESHVS